MYIVLEAKHQGDNTTDSEQAHVESAALFLAGWAPALAAPSPYTSEYSIALHKQQFTPDVHM